MSQQCCPFFFHLAGDRVNKRSLKTLQTTQKIGIQHVHQAPQFVQVVLHGSTAQGHAVQTSHTRHRLMNLRCGCLESLALVKYDDAKLTVCKIINIVEQRAVSSQHHIPPHHVQTLFSTFGDVSCVCAYLQGRRETVEFVVPVVYNRCRCHDQ